MATRPDLNGDLPDPSGRREGEERSELPAGRTDPQPSRRLLLPVVGRSATHATAAEPSPPIAPVTCLAESPGGTVAVSGA